MTSKERLMTAVHRGVPDRVPASVHQWQPYHLDHYVDGMSDIEAFRHFGLDASLGRFPTLPVDDPHWVVEEFELPAPTGERLRRYRITTPDGTLEYSLGSNEITGFIIEHIIKTPDDVELWSKYVPLPKLDRESLRRDYDEMGDDGIMRSCVWGDQGGPWQHACCLMGTTQMIMAAADEPAWVLHFLDLLWEKKERWMRENLPGAAIDLIETGGGASSSTVISPTYFREFCLPYDQKMHDLLREMGFPSVYHTCGGMMPMLENIAETRADAAETLTPPSMGGDARPAELKSRIGDRMALIGGLDQSNVLEVGSKEDVRRHVLDMFEGFGPGGGYIMSPSDHFFHIPPENLFAYAEAARECVYA